MVAERLQKPHEWRQLSCIDCRCAPHAPPPTSEAHCSVGRSSAQVSGAPRRTWYSVRVRVRVRVGVRVRVRVRVRIRVRV